MTFWIMVYLATGLAWIALSLLASDDPLPQVRSRMKAHPVLGWVVMLMMVALFAVAWSYFLVTVILQSYAKR